MLNRQNVSENIIERIYILNNFIKKSGKLNLNNINIHAENFYRDLLNILFNYELKNENPDNPNAKAIDLADDKNKIAIQITSNNNIEKIKNTVKGFVELKLHEMYELKVFIIGDKKDYKIKQIKYENFIFNIKKNVWDNNKLNKIIMDKSLGVLNEISEFLDQEISTYICSKLGVVPNKTVVKLETSWITLNYPDMTDEFEEIKTEYLEVRATTSKSEFIEKFSKYKLSNEILNILHNNISDFTNNLEVSNEDVKPIISKLGYYLPIQDVIHPDIKKELYDFLKGVNLLLNDYENNKKLYDSTLRAVTPYFNISNNGTEPAKNITIYIKNSQKINYYHHLNKVPGFKITSDLKELAFCLVKYLRNNDKSNYSVFRNKYLDYRSKYSEFKSYDNNDSLRMAIQAEMSMKIKKIKFFNVSENRIRLDYDNTLKHNFRVIFNENDDVFLVADLEEEETLEVEYEAHADNLPIPSKGVLKIIGKENPKSNLLYERKYE